MGGIEDLADQTGLMNDVIDKSDIDQMTAAEGARGPSYMEEMIHKYTTQNLDGIEQMVNGDSRIDRSRLLYHRNVKMARRMDSLSQQRSIFFAVGAAHLAGDSGVIRMLRLRGFTVSPVLA